MPILQSIRTNKQTENPSILIYTSALRLLALRGLRTLCVHRVALRAPGVTQSKLFLEFSTPIHCDSNTEVGNKLFKECRYVQAIVQYTYAIQDNPYDAELYASRGLAYVNMACYEDALLDFWEQKHFNLM